jgi:sugar/nucleoside kinase (ribokinase family)
MIANELKFDPHSLRYTGIIGTGGIGSGKFFQLNGDHTLGREESRSGHFLNVIDYCKQHIILHYIKVLLGPSFSVIPVGKIGDDDIGQILFNEMSKTGFVMNRIEKVPYVSTLFSFCFYYPDGSGGNMTTDNSASAQVDAAFVETAGTEIEKFGTKGIIMAAPEVPLIARHKLLELGKKHGLFCTASFTTEEIDYAIDAGVITNVDLIAINIDEASAVAGSFVDKTNTASIVQSAIQKLQMNNKNIMASITAGKQGSWCWDGHQLNSFPAIKTETISTAGAGDAFFSGIICGLALGLHLFEAQQLASLVAGLSVTSPNTIHKGIDRHTLYKFLHTSDLTFSKKIIKLLED